MMKSMFKDRKADIQKQSGIKKDVPAGHSTLELANHSAGIHTQRVETEHSREKQKNLTSELKNQDLMARLASGGKAMVDKKAMRKLTIKNYEKLPEILKKKKEEKQREEQQANKARQAAFRKELDQRIRNSLKKKRDVSNNAQK